jgi:Protein of unknown function (DUF2971)
MFDFVPKKSIPPEEAAAIHTKIWELVKARHQARQLPPILYHYTDAAGLKGIVESGAIRATHIAFMNDASEYLHAVALLLENVKLGQARVTDPLQLGVLGEIEEFIGDMRPEHAAPYFVTCFSALANSLNQWRAYGRGEGGFSIGFDASKLDAQAAKQQCFTSPAIYDRDEQTQLVREFLAWVLEEYPRAASKHATEQAEHREAWTHVMLWRLSAIAPIMKNPAFFEEEEWRLIHLPESIATIRFLPKPTKLVPFVELKIGSPSNSPDHVPIKVLWSGPGRDSDISLFLAGRALLEQYGYFGVALKPSNIPYRVG